LEIQWFMEWWSIGVMNCYLTAETLRSQRNDLPFCFSLRRRKAKLIHLRWVAFLKAMACSIYCLLWPFAAAASAAEWFSIAALSAAMEKDILLRVLCASSEAPL
jgi:hypothetical protein